MKQFSHPINYKKLGSALGLSEELAKRFLDDGRIMGRLGEFILEQHGIGSRSDNENTPYDNVTTDGTKIEVRSITDQVSFASSKEVGFGRHVTEEGFTEKLNSLDFYCCIDFRNLSTLNFIPVTKDDILEMQREGRLRKNKSVGKNSFFKYIENKNT